MLRSIDVCVLYGDNCTNGCVIEFNNLNNNIIIILMQMLIVLSSWHMAQLLWIVRSFDECRLNARWFPIHRPSQSPRAVSVPLGCCYLHPPLPFTIIILHCCYLAQKLIFILQSGGMSRPRHSIKSVQLVPRLCIAVVITINTCPWDSILGSLTLQLVMLPLDDCNMDTWHTTSAQPKILENGIFSFDAETGSE